MALTKTCDCVAFKRLASSPRRASSSSEAKSSIRYRQRRPLSRGQKLTLRQPQGAHQQLKLPARQCILYRRAVGTNAEIRFVRTVRGIG
ncbi:Uncharacterised protein [Klebsiella oxytoca]|nr:Uncharacterised protein [Klebsiella oxytoca]